MLNPSNRRNFLKRAALWPIGATMGSAALASPAPPTETSADGQPLKVSLNAYSFAQALTTPAAGGKAAMSLFDVLDFCAQYNFDGIDATGYYFPGYPKAPADSYIYDFKRQAHKLGLAITGTGVKNNFAQADAVKRAADVQLVKDWIEVAAKLGAPVLRVFAGPAPDGHPWDEVAAWLADDLRQCVEYGRQHGVLVGIQNHADFLQTADEVLKLLKLVDSAWFGVVLDTGSFQTGDPYAQIAQVVPYAVNFQIKESPMGSASPVRMDLKKLLQIIRAGGYRGYLPIEALVTPGTPYQPRILLPQMLQRVRLAIEQTDGASA